MPSAKTKARTPRQTKLSFGPPKSGDRKSTGTTSRQPANGNILNFFKKVEIEETLFIDAPVSIAQEAPASEVKDISQNLYEVSDSDSKPSRFNEDGGSSKRRKLSHGEHDGLMQTPDSPSSAEAKSTITAGASASIRKQARGRGPFLDDSDSEEETLDKTVDGEPAAPRHEHTKASELNQEEVGPEIPDIPPLKQEDSVYEHFRDMDEMGGLLDDDEFDDGEEYREMRYQQEQARLEAEEAGNYSSEDLGDETTADECITEKCPLCDVSLAGITADEATRHVNACLDGNPIPVPTPSKPPSVPATQTATVDGPEISKRFSKAAVPRPGQMNPIHLGGEGSKAASAFSMLMSGHAEDEAWASAAATERESRGKQAYQRTCPFYKIMPGFYICVDAFRYGAVQGCNAYFLSHFHSDHYVGLTSNWSHGPIYCSKVTGSLVKSQLRTNAKWVVELEFEETVEVPGTEGVTVTMIPANHCPGSSLFLFEKSIGKGQSSRKQRILHCGDFRACPAQVTHSLLKPNIVDSVLGKTRQQKIDVCYLDTTYLNPRYSFPSQEDVITACAEFCKTISGDPNARDDAYDALKREKGATSVSKFFKKEPSNDALSQPGSDDGPNPKQQHRLLVVCGTYSIGKERICKAIAQALHTKIFASPSKIKMVKQLGDPELSALLTSDPREGQVHMQMLMEIRAETLQEYLNGYKPHFTRIVGFRPSGWNYRNPSSTAKHVSATVSPSAVPTTNILHGPLWKTVFGPLDFVAQRGSTREAMCFGVPYSEHSSFRELALFVMSLRIEKVVPTVNVGSEQSRKRMKGWIDRWMTERRKGGIVRVLERNQVIKDDPDGAVKSKDNEEVSLWDGKDGMGGAVVW